MVRWVKQLWRRLLLTLAIGATTMLSMVRAAEPDGESVMLPFQFDSIPCSQWGPVHADGQYPVRDAKLFRNVLEIPGGYINDHCLIRAHGLWHLFCIQGEKAKPGQTWMRPGNESKIGHAVSKDLLHWQLMEPALQIGASGQLDSGHLYAPYVLEREGVYYMFYAGLIEERYGMRIFLATSKDLNHWHRHPANPIFASDPSWAAYRPEGFQGGLPGPCGCRDPHVVSHPKYGYIMYFAEHIKPDPQRGVAAWQYAAIGAATSSDLVHWQDRGPVLVRDRRPPEIPFNASPESPCVLLRNGWYYLFWKQGSGTRYTMSRDPLCFRDRESFFLGTCHASEIVAWNDTWFATSCSRDVDDVNHQGSDRARGLFLAGLEWDGIWPRLRHIAAP